MREKLSETICPVCGATIEFWTPQGGNSVEPEIEVICSLCNNESTGDCICCRCDHPVKIPGLNC